MILKRLGRSGRNESAGGFTLLETIGIVAVASILAAAIVPALIAQIDRVAAEEEEAALLECAEGLLDYVAVERVIPGDDLAVLGDLAPASGMLSNAIAKSVGMRLDEIRINDRGNARKFICDPNFWEGVSMEFPVSQLVDGWPKPDNPRALIVSSNGAPLPAAGFDFEDLWMAADGTEISTGAPWDTWSGNWDDIKIQRVHMGHMFHHLVLNNVELSLGAGYKVDGVGDGLGNPMSLVPGSVDAYYLEGAKLQLYSEGTLVATEIITSDRAYFYEDGIWRSSAMDNGSASSWVDDICDDIRNWVDEYGYTDEWVDVVTTSEIFDIGADYCATLEE